LGSPGSGNFPGFIPRTRMVGSVSIASVRASAGMGSSAALSAVGRLRKAALSNGVPSRALENVATSIKRWIHPHAPFFSFATSLSG
jgi:hypothetical protein